MQLPSWRKLAMVGGITIIGGLGFWNICQAEAQAMTTTDYVLVSQNLQILTQPNAVTPVVVGIRNLSNQVWLPGQLKLGAVFSTGDTDRASAWMAADWPSETRAASINQPVYPNQTATFIFSLKAPTYRGLYKEYFRPVLEGVRWLDGDPISVEIQVGDQVEALEVAPAKEIQIYRSTQQMNWLENGYIVATVKISSGKSGYTTPAGKYTIMNHEPDAYSSEYDLWMPNWMALSSNRFGFLGYGLHSLPYWRVNPAKYVEGKIYPGGRLYTNGRLYEGYSHLGLAVSHGCVRSGIKESGILYNWAPNGTPVTIV